MTRIRITGLHSFRPTIESLESRELMDAGFGHAVQVPLARPEGGDPQQALVRQLASEPIQQVHSNSAALQTAPTPGQQADLDLLFTGLGRQAPPPQRPHALGQASPQELAPQGQLQAPSVQRDANGRVYDIASQFLRDKVIEGGKNRWALKNNIDSVKTVVDGNRITFTFEVQYTDWGKTKTAEVKLIFEGKNTGGLKEYKLVGAGLHNWTDLFGGRSNNFENVAKGLFQKHVGKIECQRFDERKFAQDVAQQVSRIALRNGHENVQLTVKGYQASDGRIRVEVWQNRPGDPDWRDGYILEFKCEDHDVQAGSLSLDKVEKGCWSGATNRFHGLQFANREVGDLKSARWSVG